MSNYTTAAAVYIARNGRILGRRRNTSDWIDLCGLDFFLACRALVIDAFEA